MLSYYTFQCELNNFWNKYLRISETLIGLYQIEKIVCCTRIKYI